MTISDRLGDGLLWVFSYIAAAAAAGAVVTISIAVERGFDAPVRDVVGALSVWPFFSILVVIAALPGALALSALPEAFGVPPRYVRYGVAGAVNGLIGTWVFHLFDAITRSRDIVDPISFFGRAPAESLAVFFVAGALAGLVLAAARRGLRPGSVRRA